MKLIFLGLLILTSITIMQPITEAIVQPTPGQLLVFNRSIATTGGCNQNFTIIYGLKAIDTSFGAILVPQSNCSYVVEINNTNVALTQSHYRRLDLWDAGSIGGGDPVSIIMTGDFVPTVGTSACLWTAQSWNQASDALATSTDPVTGCSQSDPTDPFTYAADAWRAAVGANLVFMQDEFHNSGYMNCWGWGGNGNPECDTFPYDVPNPTPMVTGSVVGTVAPNGGTLSIQIH